MQFVTNDKQMAGRVNPESQTLVNGFQAMGRPLARHPLEALEATRDQRRDNQEFALLKSMQGIHAPLRLIHERAAAQQVSRLPVLNSSNLMMDVLTGKDETIGPEDFLNDATHSEVLAPTHMVCERHGL